MSPTGTTHGIGSGVSGCLLRQRDLRTGGRSTATSSTCSTTGGRSSAAFATTTTTRSMTRTTSATAGQRTLHDGTVINIVNGIFRSKQYDANVLRLRRPAAKTPTASYIPDDRTLADSKVKTWRETTWSFGAEYVPTDNTMYLRTNLQGLSGRRFCRVRQQDSARRSSPEIVINYEAGVKGTVLRENARYSSRSAPTSRTSSSFWIASPNATSDGRPSSSSRIRASQLYTGETQCGGRHRRLPGIEAQGILADQ